MRLGPPALTPVGPTSRGSVVARNACDYEVPGSIPRRGIGWVGFQRRRGVDTALWLEPPLIKKQGSIDAPPPPPPTETDPRAPEVTRTQNSAKK